MTASIRLEPRSLLFVPADAERFIAKAPLRGADVIVLDLEDGVAPLAKAAARSSLAHSIPRLRGAGTTVYVRVNNEPGILDEDLAALVDCAVSGIVMPKVESADQLARLDRWAADRNSQDDFGVIGLIESPSAVCRPYEIVRSSARLVALCFGSEDFAAAMGVEPSADSLGWPAHAVAIAALPLTCNRSAWSDRSPISLTFRRTARSSCAPSEWACAVPHASTLRKSSS